MEKTYKIGDQNGLLTIKAVVENNTNDKRFATKYLCECICGEELLLTQGELNRKKSCNRQKHQGDVCRKNFKKQNKYDLSGTYGIGWTTNTDKEFYFDLEDYDKIKDYSWRESCGYVVNNINEQKIQKYIVQYDSEKNVVDHRNRNKFDNRKKNLRITTQDKNSYNKSISTQNTSGVIGVSFSRDRNKWEAKLGYQNKTIHLGRYTNFYDAVVARLKAEKEYFGSFAPQQHLYLEYGIE